MRKSAGCLMLFTFAAACLAQQNSSSTHFDGKSWWGHVKFLADDSLEGRNTAAKVFARRKHTRWNNCRRPASSPRARMASTGPFGSRNSKLTNPNHGLRSLPTENRTPFVLE
jgi:hypothetical protein